MRTYTFLPDTSSYISYFIFQSVTSARYFAEHYRMTGPTTANSYGRLIMRILTEGRLF